MKKISKYGWMNVAFSAALTLSLLACGGNKNSGVPGNGDINDAIPKVSTTDNSGAGGLDTKDSATEDANDICSSQKDAYAVYGSYTMHPRDYVFNIAKEDGFDALYTAKPATLTAVDQATALTYYVQSDKQLMGRLSAKIEMQYAAFQAAIEKGDYKIAYYTYKSYSELSMMTQARKSLVAYNTIFGLKAGWVETKDLDGELAAALKPARDKVAATDEAELSAAKKAELDSFIVEAAKMNTMRIDNKDYAVHTIYDKDRDARVELVAVATGYNYATYKDYKEAAYVAAVKERVENYTAQSEELEAKYTAQYANKATMQPAEFATMTATFQQQYKDVMASRELVASFVTGISRAIGSRDATAATVDNNSRRAEEIQRRMKEIDSELAKQGITKEQSAALLQEKDKLAKELAALQANSNQGIVDSQNDTNNWVVPAATIIENKDKEEIKR